MTPTVQSLDPETFAQLRRMPLFLGLAEADTRILVGSASVQFYPDSVPLFDRGMPADRLFLVLDGHVEIFLDENNRRSILEMAKPPAMLGEAALFTDGRYANGARAAGHARVLAIPAEAFRTVLDTRFDLTQRMLASMSMRLRGMISQIAELKLKSAAQRVGGFLLGLTEARDGRAVVKFPYDKRLAADYLGMTAESLSRALQRLSAVGVKSRADNVVEIAELRQLHDFCVEDEE